MFYQSKRNEARTESNEPWKRRQSNTRKFPEQNSGVSEPSLTVWLSVWRDAHLRESLPELTTKTVQYKCISTCRLTKGSHETVQQLNHKVGSNSVLKKSNFWLRFWKTNYHVNQVRWSNNDILRQLRSFKKCYHLTLIQKATGGFALSKCKRKINTEFRHKGLTQEVKSQHNTEEKSQNNYATGFVFNS